VHLGCAAYSETINMLVQFACAGSQVEPDLESALHTLLLTSEERVQRRLIRWARVLQAAAAAGDMDQVTALLEDMVA
jgi:hypothetical protein